METERIALSQRDWLRSRGRYLRLRHCPIPAPPIHLQEFIKVFLRTIPGGHFYMAENRTFLLCVDKVVGARFWP